MMILKILRNDISRVVRTRLPYFGIAAVWLVCVIIFIFTSSLRNSQAINAWGFMGFSLQGAFADVGMVFIIIFSTLLISEETGSGTIRMVLSSPVLRVEFYIAKILTGILYMIAMSVSALIVSYILGTFHFDFTAVEDAAGLVYTRREVLLNFIFAFFLSWVPLTALVTYGIFLSACIQKPGSALGVSIGILIFVETLKHFVNISQYVCTTYIGTSWVIFHEVAQGVNYQWFPEIWRALGVSAVYIVVSLFAGLLVFSRRDLNQ